MSTALYREYLKRTLTVVEDTLKSGQEETDALKLSSGVLYDIILENLPPSVEMPHWCKIVTLEEYQDRAFERPRLILKTLLNSDRYSKEHNPSEGRWTITGDSVIVSVSAVRFTTTKADIPDWIMDDTGSASGQIMLKKEPLEAFLGKRVGRPHRWFFW